MADIRQYISVLKPPSSDSNLVLNFKSLSPMDGTYVDQDFTVTLSEADDEIETANKIYTGVNTTLEAQSLNYAGVPNFSDPPTKKFQLYQCDHIINVWSEANFRMRVKTPADGAVVLLSDFPVYATLDDADSLADLLGVYFSTDDGTPYTNDQIANALKMSSQKIASVMGDAIVASIYQHSIRTNLQSGFHVDHTPVIQVDSIVDRLPWQVGLPLGVQQQIITNDFNVEYDTGFISFSFPLDLDNVLKFNYVAGQSNVHDALRSETVRICRYLKLRSDVKQIKGADFSMTFNQQEVNDSIMNNLSVVL